MNKKENELIRKRIQKTKNSLDIISGHLRDHWNRLCGQFNIDPTDDLLKRIQSLIIKTIQMYETNLKLQELYLVLGFENLDDETKELSYEIFKKMDEKDEIINRRIN